MALRNLLSILDLGPENLSYLIDRSLADAGAGDGVEPSLEGKIVGIYFRKSSTRTRTSFTVAALKLGAKTIHYGPHDLQLVTGETAQDTARVLAGFIDALVIRTNESVEEMKQFAGMDRMAVINAMSENEHPTQAIADLTTIKQEFGSLEGVHLLYLGEGNNTTAALALSCAMIPRMQLTIITPEGYGLPSKMLDTAQGLAQRHETLIEQHHRLDALPKNVDVVYTTRWQTMGEPKAEAKWQDKFEPYKITPALMARVSKSSGTIFMHDLPAVRGAEVLDEVLDGAQSRAFRQSQNKLYAAMSVLDWCLGNS